MCNVNLCSGHVTRNRGETVLTFHLHLVCAKIKLATTTSDIHLTTTTATTTTTTLDIYLGTEEKIDLLFLDPVGSLVSVLVCWCVGVLVCWCVSVLVC